jgi:hypothetical protein
MASELTRLTHKIAIELHLVAKSCILCSSRSRRPVREVLDTPSSVGIELGYGLDNRGSRVRFPAEAGNFSFHHRVQNGSGAHPASYPIGTRGSFSGGKAAGS